MMFLSSITNLLQTVAAFLIFVVGYLTLLFSVFAILLVLNLLYKGALLLRSQIKARAADAEIVPARVAADGRLAPCDVHVMSQQLITSFRQGTASAMPKTSSQQGF